MLNKLAKLKYLANNFEIIEDGDHRDLHILARRQRQMCIRDSNQFLSNKSLFIEASTYEK